MCRKYFANSYANSLGKLAVALIIFFYLLPKFGKAAANGNGLEPLPDEFANGRF